MNSTVLTFVMIVVGLEMMRKKRLLSQCLVDNLKQERWDGEYESNALEAPKWRGTTESYDVAFSPLQVRYD